MTKQRVIIKDPLYKQIFVEENHKKYLDSYEFQRLRQIKQTAFTNYVYPSATHSRLTHSLGVYHLMKKVFANNLMKVDTKTKENHYLAALLHDLGHGPFSHLWERVFPHFDHEKSTQKILRKMGLNEVANIIAGKSDYYYLLSSTIDVDKLDYMARDSYFAGVSYGVAEVDFIIEHMYIKDKKLIIKPSALSSVEDLITQRVNLFKTVYFHKFALKYDFLFIKIFQRVAKLLKTNQEVYMNKHLKSFFNKKDTIKDLLELNDVIIMNHIFEWSHSNDEILCDLADKFIHRKKSNIINLNHSKKININKIKEKIAKKYDLNYYFSEMCYPINIIQTPIFVEIDDKIEHLEEVSELIKFYKSRKLNVQIIFFPKDIKY